jgi:hypothetical protein
MSTNLTGLFRHRLVVPDLPAPVELFPLFELRDNGGYSNFGPLVRRLEGALLTAFGASEESCVTCCNATAGLSAALLATGRIGERILIPMALSFGNRARFLRSLYLCSNVDVGWNR